MEEALSKANEGEALESGGDLTRRDFLRYTGYSAAALALLTQMDALRTAAAAQPITAASYPPGGGKLQLPFWSDGANWNQSLYYQTIQAGFRRFPKTRQNADVNGSGQDSLLGRSAQTMLSNAFDPTSGQWLQLPDGPPWSNADSISAAWAVPTIQTADIDGDGLAEVMGWDGYHWQVWKYNAAAQSWSQMPDGPAWQGVEWTYPQCYTTIQCADIDGDGQDELLARAPDSGPFGSGLQVWKYIVAASAWSQLNGIAVMTDANAWNQPQYYETIQCADVDGDGAAEVMARNGNGMTGWKYSAASQSWNQLPTNGNFADSHYWNLPQYYQAIQFADIDGDGRAELLARGTFEFFVYKYNASGQWQQMPDGPPWTDASNWNNPQYYQTIQAADIDGDGAAELIGRDGAAIEAWKYNPSAQSWGQLPDGPPWADGNGWNQVQYYSTIQTAVVNSPAGLPGKRAVLLGRGPLGMQTWYYNAGTWQQTSAPYPAFTPTQQAAYFQLDTALRFGNANGNIRSVYNDETANFADWMGRMYSFPPSYNTPPAQRPHTLLPLPQTNPPTQADWDAVTWQIYWEMSYVGTPGSSINDYYGNKVSGLITTAFLGQGFTLQTVGGTLSLPVNSNAGVVLSIFSLLAQMTGALAGLPALEAGTASAISNALGVAFAASAQFLPNGGGGFKQAYNQLQTTLSDSFDQTVTQNGNSQFAITGGTDGNNNYVPGDWGLMSVIGPYIQNAVWGWPSTTDDTIAAMQQSYAITVSQGLLPVVPWEIWTTYNYGYPPYEAPSDFPSQYLYYSSNTQYCSDGSCVSWISESGSNGGDIPSNQALALIFDSPVSGQWNPLGASINDVYIGQNGWPNLNGDGATPPKHRSPAKPRPEAELRLKTKLTRDANTGEILVALTLLNRGWTTAGNVEVTQARLQTSAPQGGLPTRHTVIARSKSETLTLRFPPLAMGRTVILRVSGRYLGGTFGGSFRVKIP